MPIYNAYTTLPNANGQPPIVVLCLNCAGAHQHDVHMIGRPASAWDTVFDLLGLNACDNLNCYHCGATIPLTMPEASDLPSKQVDAVNRAILDLGAPRKIEISMHDTIIVYWSRFERGAWFNEHSVYLDGGAGLIWGLNGELLEAGLEGSYTIGQLQQGLRFGMALGATLDGTGYLVDRAIRAGIDR